MTLRVEKGPTGVAGVDGRISLNHVAESFAGRGRRVRRRHGATERGDDSLRHGGCARGESQSIANGHHGVADDEGRRVTERHTG